MITPLVCRSVKLDIDCIVGCSCPHSRVWLSRESYLCNNRIRGATVGRDRSGLPPGRSAIQVWAGSQVNYEAEVTLSEADARVTWPLNPLEALNIKILFRSAQEFTDPCTVFANAEGYSCLMGPKHRDYHGFGHWCWLIQSRVGLNALSTEVYFNRDMGFWASYEGVAKVAESYHIISIVLGSPWHQATAYAVLGDAGYVSTFPLI